MLPWYGSLAVGGLLYKKKERCKIERYMWHCSQMTDAEVATLTLSMATWHLAWQPEVSS